MKIQERLSQAVSAGDNEEVKKCLAEGADINADSNSEYNISDTPINLAIKNK